MENTPDPESPRIDYLYFGRIKTIETRIMNEEGDEEEFTVYTHNGVLTAAYWILEEAAGERVEAAFAYCSPEDQYVKAIGRSKAHKRLKWGRTRNTKGTHDWVRWGTSKGEDNVITCVCRIFNEAPPIWSRTKPLWIRDWILHDGRVSLEELTAELKEADLVKRIVGI